MKTKLTVIFFLLVFVAPGMLTAETPLATPPQVTSSSPSEVGTYDQLVAAIRKARGESQARVEQAVAQEKVRENWETGKLIDAHVLQHKERADYGSKLLERLAGDLGTSRAELSYMLQFARAYPIFPSTEKLSWSDYRELLSVNDSKERDELAEKASNEHWSQDQLRAKIKESKAAKNEAPVATPAEEKLTAKLGKPGTYKMVKVKGGPEMGQLVIDLGFSNYYRTSRPLGFKEGAIVESLVVRLDGNSSPSDKIKLSKRTADDLYTYRASIIEVLDGDTVNAVVDLGFGVRSLQTLRLRGIDAPEMVSKEGKEAKAFLESVIANPMGVKQSQDDGIAASQKALLAMTTKPLVLIKTVKSDKYDRYLADIFVTPAPNGQGRLRQELDVPVRAEVYVNQKLVERGFATRVKDN